MSAIIESYKQMYAAKNQAVKQGLKRTKKQVQNEQKALRDAAADTLRKAYALQMQNKALSDQQNRADGRFGGAAENQKKALAVSHETKRQEVLGERDQKVASLNAKLQKESDAAAAKIAENNAALQQKTAAQLLKEQKAAASAAQKASKSAASDLKATRTRVLQMMKMGLYDTWFADVLGIPDEQVLAYLQAQDQEKLDKLFMKKNSK